MHTPLAYPVFPLGRTLGVMTLVAAVVLVLQLVFIPRVFGSPEGSIAAILFMGPLAWLSGMVSILPIVREQGKGPLAVFKVFLIGMGVRVLVAVVAIIIAIKALHLPEGPVAVSTMMMYLPLLFVETRTLSAYVRIMSQPGNQPGNGGDGQGSKENERTNTTAISDSKPQAAEDAKSAPCTEALA